MSKTGTILKTILKSVLFLLVLTGVGYAIYQQWQKIDFSQVTIRLVPMVLALGMLIGVSTVQMISYRMLLRAYARPPGWLAMLAVAWVPPLGKYIPGKVAALMAAMALLKRFSIPTAVAVSVVLVLDGLAVLAGLISGLPVLYWEPVRQIVPWAWVACIPVIATGVVCLWPSVFGRLINLLLTRLGKSPLPRLPTASEYLVPVLCAFSQWGLAGLSLMWMVESITDQDQWHRFPLFISFAALSQTIGYLALFAPGGIGVREAILLAGLTPLVGPLVGLIVPLRALSQIVVDVMLACIGLGILARLKSSPGTIPATSSAVIPPSDST
ncbi:MAG: membrane protein [Phycisphaerae bacterium]|jgi:hypothetical protein|nr:MAG: membrane protein [Phycisphaerae bacterium]